ncbi:hypothetical protein TNCV_638481 [Trichonephila clavipes]|nr:hypothetical protein TNCV_638481 [Trichonephila clavipes]
MSTVHRTIGARNSYGFQSRVNETMDELLIFHSTAIAVKSTTNNVQQTESAVFMMWLHDPPLPGAQFDCNKGK